MFIDNIKEFEEQTAGDIIAAELKSNKLIDMPSGSCRMAYLKLKFYLRRINFFVSVNFPEESV